MSCGGLKLILDMSGNNDPDVGELIRHYEECEECTMPEPLEDNDPGVIAAYLANFDDPEFDSFQDRYRGTYPSLGDFWEDFLSEVYSGELEEFERLAQALSIRIYIPHDFDEIAVEQDFVFDDETGAVFWIH